jgi:hypothetical protein
MFFLHNIHGMRAWGMAQPYLHTEGLEDRSLQRYFLRVRLTILIALILATTLLLSSCISHPFPF